MAQLYCKLEVEKRGILLLIFVITVLICGVPRSGYAPPAPYDPNPDTRSVAENTPSGRKIGSPVTTTFTEPPENDDGEDGLRYDLSGTDAGSFTLESSTGQLRTKAALDYETKNRYSVIVTATAISSTNSSYRGDSEQVNITIRVTNVDEPTNPPRQAPSPPNHVPNIDAPTNPPKQTGGNPGGTPIEEVTPRRRLIIFACPVGWQKQDSFGNTTKRALIQAVEVEVDTAEHRGIYKPIAIEIYAHPDEELHDLNGWKLMLGLPYNAVNRVHALTAENSAFNEEGIARIESPEADPFPMTEVGFIGQRLPGFDYRLFDENGVRVDFGISCYKTGGLTPRLWNMETPAWKDL